MTDFEIQTTESVTVIQTSETVFEIHSAEAPTVIETPAQQGPVGPSGLAEGLPTDPLAYYILSRS